MWGSNFRRWQGENRRNPSIPHKISQYTSPRRKVVWSSQQLGTAEVHRVRSHSRRNHVCGLSPHTCYFQPGQKNEAYRWSLFEKKIKFTHLCVITNAEHPSMANKRRVLIRATIWTSELSDGNPVLNLLSCLLKLTWDTRPGHVLLWRILRLNNCFITEKTKWQKGTKQKKKSFESHSYEAHDNANHKNIKDWTWLVSNTHGWNASTKIWKIAVGEKPNTCL